MTARYAWVALIAIVGIVSCKREGCNVPSAFNYDPEGTSDEHCIYEPLKLRIEAMPYVGEEPLVEGKTYTTADGRDIVFDFFAMYLSEIRVRQGGEEVEPGRDVFLVTDSTGLYESIVFPRGEVDGLDFTLGIDSGIYYSDPATYPDDHPLSALSSYEMYWSWANGYRYLRLEGRVDTTAAASGDATTAFAYHTGLDQNLRHLSFDASAIEVSGQRIKATVRIDLAKILENIDFTNANERVTHTTNNPALAAKISDNAAGAISLE